MGTEEKREGNIKVGNIHQLPPTVPDLGIEPTAQGCALTRDGTCNPLVYGTTLQPLATRPAVPH